MRGFAQTLFNVLLGWIRTVVEGVWSLLFTSGTQAWLQWIAGNGCPWWRGPDRGNQSAGGSISGEES